ncbi:MAG: hypothetical protein FWE98_04530 [Oscillospiraceae bacterium]|nr:hypothetical protein [Oscillospiraceae bacterium]
MKKLKIYLETTVFNRYFEPERDNYRDTVRLFEEIAEEKFEAYASEYVLEELSRTEGPKLQNMLELLEQCGAILLKKSDEIEALAYQYAVHEIISENHEYDRWHIACASVHGMDALVSLNFTHINRLWTKDKMRYVNPLNGYPAVSIIAPMEVINNGN